MIQADTARQLVGRECRQARSGIRGIRFVGPQAPIWGERHAEETEALQAELRCAIREKEERIDAANRCVNDVKDIVDDLGRKLRENEVDLAAERDEVARLQLQLEESRRNGALRRRGSDHQLEELSSILTQVQASHDEEQMHSQGLAVQLERCREESAALRAEVACLQDAVEGATTAKVEAEARLEEAAQERRQLVEELDFFQVREQKLGDELEHFFFFLLLEF